MQRGTRKQSISEAIIGTNRITYGHRSLLGNNHMVLNKKPRISAGQYL